MDWWSTVSNDLILLSDAAGEVVEVGAGVKEFKIADAVVSTFHRAWLDGHLERSQLVGSPGGPGERFACEFVTRPVTHFTRAPEGPSYAERATLPCAGVTAWRALFTDGHLKPGDTVLILGTGGVSLFALQFAKAAGATVIATSSSAEKIERLKALGADHVINHREIEKWGELVVSLTDGLGVDHIVEVGGPNTLPQSLIAARTGAHVAIIGAVAGFKVDTIPFAIVQAKRLRLQGVTVGSRRDQAEMVRAIETTNIRPVIDRTFHSRSWLLPSDTCNRRSISARSASTSDRALSAAPPNTCIVSPPYVELQPWVRESATFVFRSRHYVF